MSPTAGDASPPLPLPAMPRGNCIFEPFLLTPASSYVSERKPARPLPLPRLTTPVKVTSPPGWHEAGGARTGSHVVSRERAAFSQLRAAGPQIAPPPGRPRPRPSPARGRGLGGATLPASTERGPARLSVCRTRRLEAPEKPNPPCARTLGARCVGALERAQGDGACDSSTSVHGLGVSSPLSVIPFSGSFCSPLPCPSLSLCEGSFTAT